MGSFIPQAPLSTSWEHEALTQVSRAAELMSEPAQFYRWITQQLASLLDVERSVLILRHPDGEGVFRTAIPAYGFAQEGLDALRAWVDAAGDDLAYKSIRPAEGNGRISNSAGFEQVTNYCARDPDGSAG